MLNIFIKLNKYLKKFYTKINSTKIFNWLFKKWHVILLFLYGLIPLLWFKDKYMRRSEEPGYLNYNYLWEKFLYGWSSHLNNGAPATVVDHIILYPVGIFYRIASVLGIPNYIVQRLFLVLIFWLIIYSIYKLIYYFTKDKSISFLSVLFYTLTFYTITSLFYTAKMFQLFFLPLLFYLFVRYLETKKLVYLILNFLILFIFQGIFCNVPTAVVTIFVYFLALIYYYTTQVNLVKIIKDIKYIFYFALTFVPVFLNVFFLYYFSVIYNQRYEKIFFINLGRMFETKLINIFQLFRGAWWEPQTVYNLWAYFFDNPIIITISFVLFGFIFIGLFKAKENNKFRKHYLFWYLVLLFFILLTTGNSKPLGSVYNWMYLNVPLFALFREPWAKFTPVVIFSSTILFAYTLKTLRNYKKIVYPLILLLVLIHGSIFFTNNIFDHKNPGPGGLDVLIPQYWSEAQAWSKEHKNDNILALPVFYSYFYYHEWYKNEIGNYNGSLSYTFLYSNTINNDSSNGQLDKAILLEQFNPKILPLWNVRYVLDQKDISAPLSIKRTVTSQILKDQGVIDNQPDKSFGLLDIYKVSDKYFLPRIYTNSGAVYIDGDFDVLPSLLDTNYLGEKPVVLFSKQNPETKFADLNGVIKLEQRGEEWQPVLSKAPTNITEPEVNFEQINPTKYIVKINKANGPFWLVFSQNYHPYWKVYIKQNSKLKIQNSKFIEKSALLSALVDMGKRSEVKEHYLVNGYANGWYINPNKIQDFEVVLEYWPQRLFETAWFISVLVLIGSVLYLGIYYFNKRK